MLSYYVIIQGLIHEIGRGIPNAWQPQVDIRGARQITPEVFTMRLAYRIEM